MNVLAIDPGRAKCGVAVVRQDGQVLFRGIVAVTDFTAPILSLIAAHHPKVILCGNGTGSQFILRVLEVTLAHLSLPIETVDETRTSEEARARFVRENKPPLLQRLLPRSLRSPWLPYDDYVAVLLAERYWQSHSA